MKLNVHYAFGLMVNMAFKVSLQHIYFPNLAVHHAD